MKKIKMMMAAALGVLVSCGSVKSGEAVSYTHLWWALFIYFILLSVFVYMFVQYRRHKVNEGRIRDKIRSFISIRCV